MFKLGHKYNRQTRLWRSQKARA